MLTRTPTTPPLAATRTRSLAKIEAGLGDISGEIRRRLATRERVAVLDVGCGHAVALMDLRRKFGNRVDLHGINRFPEHGNHATVEAAAASGELQPSGGHAHPTIHYFDACAEWPLAAESFDVIFSRSAFLWFPDKLRAIEQVNRALRPGGIALIDFPVDRTQPPPEHGRLVTIVDRRGREVPFARFMRPYRTCRWTTVPQPSRFWKWLNRQFGRRVKAPSTKPFLLLTKTESLRLAAELVDAEPIPEPWGGVRSIYRLSGG